MKSQALKVTKYLLVFIAFLYLGGCASVPQSDEEGGISGTGHVIDCDEQRQKIGKPCI